MLQSAAERRDGRRIRFVTDASCRPVVKEVRLPAKKVNSNFFDTIDALFARGYDRNNRKYLVFMDANYLCGVGTMFLDDSPRLSNINNQIGGYARIDRGYKNSCWNGGVAAHELFHTLGGVQNSAPHASGYGHCTDEYDAMCYPDGPGVKMTVRCKNAGPWQIDWNHDDYFNPKPKDGSYLDRRWNTADSGWLQPGVPPPTAPVISLPSAAKRIAGFRWSVSATSKPADGRTIAAWS